jgi:hypothetical protein
MPEVKARRINHMMFLGLPWVQRVWSTKSPGLDNFFLRSTTSREKTFRLQWGLLLREAQWTWSGALGIALMTRRSAAGLVG